MKFLQITTPTLMACFLFTVSGCGGQEKKTDDKDAYDQETVVETAIGPLTLPSPYAEESKTKISRVVGWTDEQTPDAPEGLKVERFAEGFDHPRWVYVAPNGDLFVAESDKGGSANRITLMRDTAGTGEYDMRKTFAKNLNSPLVL